MSLPSWGDYRNTLAAAGRPAMLSFLSSVSSYRPLGHQQRAHLACAPAGGTSHKLFLGGIGAGKTKWGAAEDILLAIGNPTGWGVIMAPTFDQVSNVLVPEFMLLADEMDAMGYPLVRSWMKSTATANLVCGGKVFFRSFERVDSVRGYNLAWAHIDESEQATNPGYVFDVVSGRLRQKDVNHRQIHVTTTPKGVRGVVGKFISQRAVGDDEQKRTWWVGRAPTTSNIHLPPGYVDSLRSGYSVRQWEQEVEAKVLKPETAVWPEFERDKHVVPHSYDPALPYDIAVDWGHQFPHVLFIQKRSDGTILVFEEFCEDNIPRDHLRQFIEKSCKALGKPPQNAVTDRAVKTENRWLQSALPATWLHTMKSRQQQSVRTGIEAVRTILDPVDSDYPVLVFAAKLAKDPPRRGIIRCLEGYRYRSLPSGELSDIPWKDNVFDHGADALRYYVVACGLEERTPYVVGRTYGSGGQRATPWRKGV